MSGEGGKRKSKEGAGGGAGQGGGGDGGEGGAGGSGGLRKAQKKDPTRHGLPERDLSYAQLPLSRWTEVGNFTYQFIFMLANCSYAPFKGFVEGIGMERVVFHCCCMPVCFLCAACLHVLCAFVVQE